MVLVHCVGVLLRHLHVQLHITLPFCSVEFHFESDKGSTQTQFKIVTTAANLGVLTPVLWADNDKTKTKTSEKHKLLACIWIVGIL